VPDDFATDTVLLGGEGERDEGNAIQVGEVTRERVDAIIADKELHVAETKRVALTRTAVLAGSKQPKER
jgi:hypothetical protein